MVRPLEGVRILDLTQVLSGPYATMILADLGAEVIKLERVETGDIARGNGPFIDGLSSYFLSLNRGKKSVTIDLASEKGKRVFLELAKHADVVVENFVPGTMKRLGLDYEVIRRQNPGIIYAACSGFGQTGPYATRPALDVIVQGMGGIMSITGEPGGPPIRPGVSLGDIGAGLFLCIGILAALHERTKSGEGQMVDIGMLDCQVAILENAFARYFATGEVPRALGTRHPVFTPFQAFETKDGYIVIAMVGGVSDQWPLYCATIGTLELIDDERFRTGWLRTQNYDVLEPILAKAMKEKTTQAWMEELGKVGIPCGPVNTIDTVAADPQVAARQMIVEVPHDKLGKLKVTNTPLRFSRTACGVKDSCPGLGQHTEVVLAEIIGMAEQDIRDLKRDNVV